MKLKKEKNIKKIIKKYKKNKKKNYYYSSMLRLETFKYDTSFDYHFNEEKTVILRNLKRGALLRQIFRKPTNYLPLFKLFNEFKYLSIKKPERLISNFFKKNPIITKFEKEKVIILSQLVMKLRKFNPLIDIKDNKKVLNLLLQKTNIMQNLKKRTNTSIFKAIGIRNLDEQEAFINKVREEMTNLKKVKKNIRTLKKKILRTNLKRKKLEKNLKKLGYNINSYNSFINFFPMVKKEKIIKENQMNLKSKFINYLKT